MGVATGHKEAQLIQRAFRPGTPSPRTWTHYISVTCLCLTQKLKLNSAHLPVFGAVSSPGTAGKVWRRGHPVMDNPEEVSELVSRHQHAPVPPIILHYRRAPHLAETVQKSILK